MWVRGLPLTVPMHARYAQRSPYTLRTRRARGARCTAAASTSRRSASRRGRRSTTCRRPTASRTGRSRCCTSTRSPRPWCRSASTGARTSSARFCGIELTRGEQTIPVKTPAQLAEVCTAARDLDGAVDVTLTTGSINRRDRGALYICQCAAAIKEACGLPVQVQFEPPDDLAVLERGPRAPASTRSASTSRRSTPRCSRAVAPGKAAVRRRGLLPHLGARGRGVRARARDAPT